MANSISSSLTAFIAGDSRLDPDKVQTLAQGEGFHPGDVVFDDGGRVGLAGADFLHGLELGSVDAFHL